MTSCAAPAVEPFFDKATSTVSYVVHEGPGSRCAVIDPVLDFDMKSGRTRTGSAERIAAFVRAHGLAVEWILETHVHADHLTAAPFLKGEFGGRIGIGAGVVDVQRRFGELFTA
ncbi:MAG TPA: MBL fold metallo-hydrolase, partial [Stellaceae bacterium]